MSFLWRGSKSQSSAPPAAASVLTSDPKEGPTAEQKFLAELSMVLSEEEEEEKRQQELKAQALAIAAMDNNNNNNNNDKDNDENDGDASEGESQNQQDETQPSKEKLISNNVTDDLSEITEVDEEERILQEELKAQALALAAIDNESQGPSGEISDRSDTSNDAVEDKGTSSDIAGSSDIQSTMSDETPKKTAPLTSQDGENNSVLPTSADVQNNEKSSPTIVSRPSSPENASKDERAMTIIQQSADPQSSSSNDSRPIEQGELDVDDSPGVVGQQASPVDNNNNNSADNNQTEEAPSHNSSEIDAKDSSPLQDGELDVDALPKDQPSSLVDSHDGKDSFAAEPTTGATNNENATMEDTSENDERPVTTEGQEPENDNFLLKTGSSSQEATPSEATTPLEETRPLHTEFSSEFNQSTVDASDEPDESPPKEVSSSLDDLLKTDDTVGNSAAVQESAAPERNPDIDEGVETQEAKSIADNGEIGRQESQQDEALSIKKDASSTIPDTNVDTTFGEALDSQIDGEDAASPVEEKNNSDGPVITKVGIEERSEEEGKDEASAITDANTSQEPQNSTLSSHEGSLMGENEFASTDDVDGLRGSADQIADADCAPSLEDSTDGLISAKENNEQAQVSEGSVEPLISRSASSTSDGESATPVEVVEGASPTSERDEQEHDSVNDSNTPDRQEQTSEAETEGAALTFDLGQGIPLAEAEISKNGDSDALLAESGDQILDDENKQQAFIASETEGADELLNLRNGEQGQSPGVPAAREEKDEARTSKKTNMEATDSPDDEHSESNDEVPRIDEQSETVETSSGLAPISAPQAADPQQKSQSDSPGDEHVEPFAEGSSASDDPDPTSAPQEAEQQQQQSPSNSPESLVEGAGVEEQEKANELDPTSASKEAMQQQQQQQQSSSDSPGAEYLESCAEHPRNMDEQLEIEETNHDLDPTSAAQEELQQQDSNVHQNQPGMVVGESESAGELINGGRGQNSGVPATIENNYTVSSQKSSMEGPDSPVSKHSESFADGPNVNQPTETLEIDSDLNDVGNIAPETRVQTTPVKKAVELLTSLDELFGSPTLDSDASNQKSDLQDTEDRDVQQEAEDSLVSGPDDHDGQQANSEENIAHQEVNTTSAEDDEEDAEDSAFERSENIHDEKKLSDPCDTTSDTSDEFGILGKTEPGAIQQVKNDAGEQDSTPDIVLGKTPGAIEEKDDLDKSTKGESAQPENIDSGVECHSSEDDDIEKTEKATDTSLEDYGVIRGALSEDTSASWVPITPVAGAGVPGGSNGLDTSDGSIFPTPGTDEIVGIDPPVQAEDATAEVAAPAEAQRTPTATAASETTSTASPLDQSSKPETTENRQRAKEPQGEKDADQDDLFEEFRELRSSFRRLLTVTSSTVVTVSEVTAPALAAAGKVGTSAATGFVEKSGPAFAEASNALASSATELAGTCQREFQKRRSERNLVVAFVQEDKVSDSSATQDTERSEKDGDDYDENLHPAVHSVAQALSPEVSKSGVPPSLVLSSPSSADQYRNDISRYLGDEKSAKARAESEGCTDPVLKAAVAGAAARKSRSQRHERRGHFASQNEWTTSLNRFASLTNSTMTTAASMAAPAFKEAKDAAVEFSRFTANPKQRNEEEVIVLDNAAPETLLPKRGRNQRIFTTKHITFNKIPKSDNLKSTEEWAQEETPEWNERASKGSKDDALNLGTTSQEIAGVRATASAAGPWSTASVLTNSSVDDTMRQTRKYNTFENPKRFINFLSKKLQAHTATERNFGRQDGDVNGRNRYAFDPNNSVFASERKKMESSSISSPGSPGTMSLSSSSSVEDASTSTSIFSANLAPIADPAASLWEMIPDTPVSAISTSLPPSPQQRLRNVIQREALQAHRAPFGGDLDTDDNGNRSVSEGSDENARITDRMETHIEHPDESERSFGFSSSMDATTPTRNNNAGESDQGLVIPEGSEHADTLDQNMDHNGEPPPSQELVTPPGPTSLEGPDVDLAAFSMHSQASISSISRKNVGTTGKRSSVAQRRQRQAEKAAEQFLGVKPAKSEDVEFDDNGSGTDFMSLPETQMNENGGELMHIGCKRARDRLVDSTMNSPQGSVNWGTSSSAAGSRASYSGSRKGASYSAKRPSRRRSTMKKAASIRLLDDSVNLQPKSGQLHLSGIQRSPSGNDLLLFPGDESDHSMSFHKSYAPELDDISVVEEGSGMLDLAVVTFSSIAHSNCLDENATTEVTRPLRYLASVRWRQLLSTWKHATLAKSLAERASSAHYIHYEEGHGHLDDEENSISSSGNRRVKNRGGALDLFESHHKCGLVIHPETKNLNGLLPHLADGELQSLTGFLADFGCPPLGIRDDKDKEAPLANLLLDSKKSATLGALVDFAVSNVERYASFVENIVYFATQNHATTSDSQEAEVAYSVGIKSQDSIERKAKRKYSGDVLQVKDILRAQITFGDEGSLVAGLLHLHRLCQESKARTEDDFPIEIVRVKNLFQKDPSGELCPSSLPTGYRHILVNLRVKNGVIAEIQFQLSELFDVLGYEGYDLHQEIIEVEEACAISYQTKANKAREVNGSLEGAANGEAQATEIKKENGAKTAVPTKDPSNDTSAFGELPSKLGEISGDIGSEAKESDSTKKGAKPVEKAPESGASTETPTPAKSNDAFEKPSETADTSESDSFQPFENMNRDDQIDELRKNAKDYSRQQLLAAMRTFAIDIAAGKPRDVPTFYCLHLLSMMEAGYFPDGTAQTCVFGKSIDPYLWPLFCPEELKEMALTGDELSHKNGGAHVSLDKNLQISRECLLRCLAITNQGTSVGMTGWLEYGADNPFGRLADRPFEVLQQLAFNLACSNNWSGALDVLDALVSRCEQHLPLYHPITLSAMLDLAGAARKTLKLSLADKMVASVANRLAFYLSEQETLFFTNVDASSKNGNNGKVAVLRFENGIDSISMLRSFVDIFESQLSRAFLKLLGDASGGPCSLVKHINQCLLADALSVLANCILAGEKLFGVSPIASTSLYYWHAAYTHYEAALTGWIEKGHNLSDECVFSSAYGAARCLRELGQRQKASQILSSLVSALDTVGTQGRSEETLYRTGSGSDKISFLPSRDVASKNLFLLRTGSTSCRREELMALCMWLMATISVEDSPDERGRIRALSLLHAASEALQSVVSPTEAKLTTGEIESLSYQQSCHDILLRIEQEAKDLLEPWEAVAAEAPQRDVKASSDEKRQTKDPQWSYNETPSVSV